MTYYLSEVRRIASRKCRPWALVDSKDSPFIKSGKSYCEGHGGQHSVARFEQWIASGAMSFVMLIRGGERTRGAVQDWVGADNMAAVDAMVRSAMSCLVGAGVGGRWSGCCGG